MNSHVRPVVPLFDLVEILSGFAFKSERFGSAGELPLVRIRDVKRGWSDTYYTGEFESRYVVNDGDLLVGMDGEFNRERWRGGRALLNQRVCKLTVNMNKLDDGYLYYFLQMALKDIEDRTPFATVKHLSSKDIKAIEIPLPPLDEQRRIAAILDKADALRRKRKRALELLEGLTNCFLDDFADTQVESLTVRDLIKRGMIEVHKDGNHGSNYPRSEEFGSDGVPFFSAKNIAEGGDLDLKDVQRLNKAKASTLKIGWIKSGDVLLSHNASVGKVALYKGELGPALIGTSLTCFRPNINAISPQYLYIFMRGLKWQSQLFKNMGQTTRNQVPITAQKDLIIDIPPVAVQSALTERYQLTSGMMVSYVKHLRQLDDAFSCLQHRAFSGQL